jgi:hypothetical protein
MKETKKTYSQYFTTKERPSGEKFVFLKDEAPESLESMMIDIHFDYFDGCLLNDWIYRETSYAFERLEEYESESDYERAVCEIEPDVYTNDLIEWLKNPYATDYCNEELQEGHKPDSLENLISTAQVRAKERIYYSVWIFLQKQRGENA